jgi:hypothetical protein
MTAPTPAPSSPLRPPAAPVTYGTAEGAREYVRAVLARPVPAGACARLYLIAAPTLSNSPAWEPIRATLVNRMPGAVLVQYRDLFGRPSRPPHVTGRVDVIAAECAGAVVVPVRYSRPGGPAQYFIGPAAADEARRLVALAVPVLVLAPGDMAAWPDVALRELPPDEPRLRHTRYEVLMPARAPRPLPTVAASYRAVGIAPPRPQPSRPTGRPRAGADPTGPARIRRESGS